MSLPKVRLVSTSRRTAAGPRQRAVVRYPAFVVRRIEYSKIEQNKTSKRKHSELDEDEADCNSTRCIKAFKPCLNVKVESKEIKQELLNDTDLWTLAHSSDSILEWKEIGSRLELSELDLKLIEHRYGSDLRECFYQMLLVWRQRCPENCQLGYLRARLNVSPVENKSSPAELVARLRMYHTQLEKEYKLKSPVRGLDEITLEEKWLWECSEWICGEWKPIGRTLGLAESTLIQIESKHGRDGCRECSYQMLLNWMEQFYPTANLNTLCSGLIRLNLNWSARQLLQLVLFE